MLDIKKLTKSAEECLGWPYVSPGTNDKNGIDCSGLFVKMFRDQGGKIYHGSNTIFREYCTETGKLTSEKQLQEGMAVFKLKSWKDTDSGNRWYGKTPGNLSHIGYVASVNPLKIIHASTGPMCVTTDTAVGKWAYWGKLKNVNYGSEPSPEPSPSPTPEPEPEPTKTMYVYAENGKPVNMRTKADIHSALVEKVPVGASVIWQKEDGAGWAYVKYHGKTGWMLECFLVSDVPGTPQQGDTPMDPGDGFPEDGTIPAGEELTVWANNGKPVKLRQKPSTACKLYDDVPVGAVVKLVKYGETWTQVDYGTRKGWYMMTKFLGVGREKGRRNKCYRLALHRSTSPRFYCP